MVSFVALRDAGMLKEWRCNNDKKYNTVIAGDAVGGDTTGLILLY